MFTNSTRTTSDHEDQGAPLQDRNGFPATPRLRRDALPSTLHEAVRHVRELGMLKIMIRT